MLFSEGFENAKILSKKMTVLYTLSKEQLSKQFHYDFGLRALKSVLVMAGGLKRLFSGMSEELVLMRCLRDSNMPKFGNSHFSICFMCVCIHIFIHLFVSFINNSSFSFILLFVLFIN